MHDFNSRLLLRNGVIRESINSFDPEVSFHPDESNRIIVVNNATLRLYDIVPITAAVENSSQADQDFELIPRQIYSLDPIQPASGANMPSRTSSGRNIKRPANAAYALTSDDDESVALAWDYEDDLDLLGIVYARLVERGGRDVCEFQHLDLIESKSGVLLRRLALKDKISAGRDFDSSGILLRLDATHAIISVSRNGKSNLLIYQFISPAG